MAGEGQVFLHVLKRRRVDVGQRVLLTIDGAVLQAGVNIREGHDDDGSVQCVVHGDLHAVLVGAELDSLQILGLFQRAGVVGHVTVAALPDGQDLESHGLDELLSELGAEIAAPCITSIVQTGKQEGQQGHVDLCVDALEVCSTHLHAGLCGTATHLLNQVALTAQRAISVDLDLNAAVSALLNSLFKALQRDDGGVRCTHDRADIHRISSAGSCRCGSRCCAGDSSAGGRRTAAGCQSACHCCRAKNLQEISARDFHNRCPPKFSYSFLNLRSLSQQVGFSVFAARRLYLALKF